MAGPAHWIGERLPINYVNGFFTQYDDLVILYDEKFANPGKKIIGQARLGREPWAEAARVVDAIPGIHLDLERNEGRLEE